MLFRSEGDSTIHAAGPLNLCLCVGKVRDKLTVVFFSQLAVFRNLLKSLVLKKTSYLAHICTRIEVIDRVPLAIESGLTPELRHISSVCR